MGKVKVQCKNALVQLVFILIRFVLIFADAIQNGMILQEIAELGEEQADAFLERSNSLRIAASMPRIASLYCCGKRKR